MKPAIVLCSCWPRLPQDLALVFNSSTRQVRFAGRTETLRSKKKDQFNLLLLLIVHSPNRVLWPNLEEAFYGSDPDGGSLTPRSDIYLFLHRQRRLLEFLGFKRASTHQWNWGLALVPIEE